MDIPPLVPVGTPIVERTVHVLRERNITNITCPRLPESRFAIADVLR
jgi:hypothetical protein